MFAVCSPRGFSMQRSPFFVQPNGQNGKTRPYTRASLGLETRMAKSSGASRRSGAPIRDRRKNTRLRVLVDEFRHGISANQRELRVQFARLAQLQAELDLAKATRR